MKVVAVAGSPRAGGNTEIITRHALTAIAEEGIGTELVTLAGRDIRPCTACTACVEGERCPIKDDLMPIYSTMRAADGIILSSPVYFGSATATLKALMERAGSIARQNGDLFARKVGGPIVVARRAGHVFTYAQLTNWFTILGMVVPGSRYWTVASGREKGEVVNDVDGMQTVWKFGKNIAWLVRALCDK